MADKREQQKGNQGNLPDIGRQQGSWGGGQAGDYSKNPTASPGGTGQGWSQHRGVGEQQWQQESSELIRKGNEGVNEKDPVQEQFKRGQGQQVKGKTTGGDTGGDIGGGDAGVGGSGGNR